MDAELYAIYRALQHLADQSLIFEEVYIFVDSQASLKRLKSVSLQGGQRLCYDISTLCKSLALAGNRVTLQWVPGHNDIQGNEHADRLARAGLKRKEGEELPASLSYLKRKLQENVLVQWKTSWHNLAERERGSTYNTNVQGDPRIRLKVDKLTTLKRTMAAYSQLKLGKGFFKSFSKAIGKDDKGECFGSCTAFQTPKHLLLHCKHYVQERKKMRERLGSQLTLVKLFNTSAGQQALRAFIDETQIATAQWLFAAGDL